MQQTLTGLTFWDENIGLEVGIWFWHQEGPPASQEKRQKKKKKWGKKKGKKKEKEKKNLRASNSKV